MKYIFQDNLTEQEHDAFVTTHPLCNLLQSSKWALIKNSWMHKLVGVKNEQGKVVAASLVLIKPLPMHFTMFYLPRGPIMDFLDRELVSFFFTELKQLAKSEHCIFIKFDAGILKNSYLLENRTDMMLSSSLNIMKNLKDAGCIHQGFSEDMSETIQPRFQAPVFYDRLFEDHLPRHTKRHIKTAHKKHVTVKRYGEEMLPAFTRLMKLTEQRKHIALRDQNYFRLLLETYGPQDAFIYLAQIDLPFLLQDCEQRLNKLLQEMERAAGDAKKQTSFSQSIMMVKSEMEKIRGFMKEDGEKPYIAGALSVYYGDTAELLYMGMDGKYRKYMAPYLTHLIPMLDAFHRNCRLCNMGGLEGTLDGGLTKFKANFNPLIQEYLGEFDVPVNKFLYAFAHWAYRIRKLRRKHT